MKSRKNIVIAQTQDSSVRGQDLTDKYVVLFEKYYKGDEVRRVFRCEGGFGCSPDTMGSAVIGTMIYSGEKFRGERYEVWRMATEEEVKQAEEIREKTKKLLVKFEHDLIEGFKFFTGEEWKNYKEVVETKVQFPRAELLGKESFRYTQPEDYFKDIIEVKEITETEFYVLQKLFQDSYGHFISFKE